MFSNQIALVTGSSKGIGAAIAIELARNGAFTYINYHTNKQKAEDIANQINQEGGKAEVIQASVNNVVGVDNLFSLIKQKQNRLDILVNNAGITKDIPLLAMSEEDWDTVIDTNLKSIFLCSKAAIKLMLPNKSGCIINISSLSGLKGNQGQCSYSAAKGGMLAFSRSLAAEVAKYGIRVNSVVPGFINTDMTKNIPPAKLKGALTNSVLQRIGEADEIATVVKFLASKDASYIQGQVIVADGGILA